VEVEAYKFVVLGDLQGRSLDEFLAVRGPFPAAEACRLVRQAALGLAELHKSGQMHGEVRPANLWLDAANHVKLLHVPLSREPLASPTTGASGPAEMLQAAADYLAPELAAPQRWPATPLSDLYALGCTLYLLLVGKPPFAGGDAVSKLRRHVHEQPPLASQANPQVPPPIAQVAAYLMAKDPSARYQQAMHAAEALAPYVEAKAREPVVEVASSTTRAYEDWLTRQPSVQFRPAAAAAPMPPFAPPPAPAGPATAVPVAAVATAPYPPPQQTFAVQAGPPAAVLPSRPAPTGPVSLGNPTLALERLQKQREERRNRLIIGTGIGLTTAIVAFLVYSSVNKRVADNVPAAPSVKGGATTHLQAPNSKPSEPVAVAQSLPPEPKEEPLASLDGQLLWESPTSGEPLDLRYLPGTAKMFLALRPAELWAHPEGQQVLASLGIADLVRQQLTRLSGTTPDNLEQAVLAFSGRGMGQMPVVSLVARAIKTVDEAALKQNWNAGESFQVDGKTFYRGEGVTYYVPADGQNKVLTAVPLTDPKEIAAWLAGSKSAPVLDRHLEALVRSSDRARHATLLASPRFLLNEGRAAMVGTLDGLVGPMQSFLTDEAGDLPGAAMLSLHLSDSLFLELRATSNGETDATRLAKLYRGRVQDARDAVEQYTNSLEISQYSRPILRRYPDFFDFIHNHTRAGTNKTQVVLRTALPSIAASNLAFGTHLAMLEDTGIGSAAAAVPQTPAAATLADRLKQKYTLTFDRDSLDRTLALISQDTGIPIRIEGGDLQLEGITQNQSFGLDEKDKPVFEILKTIMKKANPDGKLIYVFQKRDGVETVVVTTRAAAAKRGDAIPAELK
jgi:hypothetical protein